MTVQWKTPLEYHQYQNVVNRMPIGFWFVVFDSGQCAIRITELNSAAANILQIPAEPMSAVETREFLENFIHKDVAQLCMGVMQTGSDRQVEDARYQVGDQILRLSLDILYEGEGSCAVLLQDNTERKLGTERRLHGQRVAHIGDWDWGLTSGTIHFSEELIRIFGFSQADLPLTFEQTIERIHPDDRASVQAALKESIETLELFSIYFRLIPPNQSQRIVHCIGHVEIDAEKRPIRLWGTTQDVTDRWLAEEQLRTSESRLQAITGAAHDAIFSFSDTGEITFWNPGAERTFHINSEKAIGLSVDHFISVPLLTEISTEAGAGDRDGSNFNWRSQSSQELTARTADDLSFPAEMSLGSWSHNEETYYTAIVRDITKRREAEKELQEFARQLEASNRELQDFAYIASHDLQEPLRKINAFSDRLRGKYSAVLDETALDYLGRMQNAAQRMQVLINDLLTLSRVTTQGQPFDPTDLNAVAHTVIDDLEMAIQQSGGEVIVDELPTLHADPLQMRQLFQNLVSNALKFRRKGVAPVVHIYSELQQPAHTTGGNRTDSEQKGADIGKDGAKVFRIICEDNGIGFDEKYIDRIFQPFQRLHGRNVYTGTGMGLAICRKITGRHHGTITAQSTPDVGTTFIVTLPENQNGPEKNGPENQNGRA